MIHFRPKQSIIGAKKGHFGQSVPENGLPRPGGLTAEQAPTGKPTVRFNLRTLESYDPIESCAVLCIFRQCYEI